MHTRLELRSKILVQEDSVDFMQHCDKSLSFSSAVIKFVTILENIKF